MDVDNIQEAIGQFYSFFGRMGQVKSEIDRLNLDDHTKTRLYNQLEEIERKKPTHPQYQLVQLASNGTIYYMAISGCCSYS